MNTHRRPLVHQTRRNAWVEVNLDYIEHNIKVLKKLLKPETKIMAVVKADSYGLGGALCSSTLSASGIHMFGVASVDEGLQLRESGIIQPILILGDTPSWAFESAVKNDISLTIFSDEHLKACSEIYQKYKKRPTVHIKVNTGMNRAGVPFDSASNFISNALEQNCIEIKGIFSHLACSENKDSTELQKLKWLKIYDEFKHQNIDFHIANTTATISYPELHFDMVRIGIGINGLLPELPDLIKKPNLKQAISLKARINNFSYLEKGDGVSYGYSYIADEPKKIATIPIGYADGIPRGLSNKIYGILNGQKIRQIGNITMDQLMLDVSNIENVKKGDIITLLGEDQGTFISVNEWAKLLDTINYEITCNLKVRLPRVYTR